MEKRRNTVQNGCYVHPDRHPVARCTECGAPLCDACISESGGKYYCGRHIPVEKSSTIAPPETEKDKIRIRPLLLFITLIPAVLLLVGALLVPDDMSALFGDYGTRVTGAQFQQINTGLEKFRDDIGRYPTDEEGLSALREEPEGVPGWLGPYLAEAYYETGEVIDISGQPVGYQLREDGYILTSAGTDGEPGTDDDIAFIGPVQ
ncbi:MAG: hypothetical protein GY771_05420 [bacterium]|nr:hypothetical protein [bacterium]